MDIPDRLIVAKYLTHKRELIGMIALWHLVDDLTAHGCAVLERSTYESMYPVHRHKGIINMLASAINKRELAFGHVLYLASGILYRGIDDKILIACRGRFVLITLAGIGFQDCYDIAVRRRSSIAYFEVRGIDTRIRRRACVYSACAVGCSELGAIGRCYLGSC